MLTRLRIRNFKRLNEADIELGKTVVFIGPNNSGKTSALQALALWDVGIRRWSEKRTGKSTPEKKIGVAINRRDLTSIPVPDANHLWRDLHVRSVKRLPTDEGSKPDTKNIRIEILVGGVTRGDEWSCGLEFDYANPESFYCRPMRTGHGEDTPRMPVPRQASWVRVTFLPPMSGLADREYLKQPGEIGVLIGQGQTAQILRNLCLTIREGWVENAADNAWQRLVENMQALFGVALLEPQYIAERGEITMEYEEPSGLRLDLSSSGRGFQQTLLLLAHLYANPETVLLIDEPDAHLEILRQRQTYQLITDVAGQLGCQIIAASHSEVVLNEAADRDVVVAFVGRPHRIDDRGSQVLKALKEIGFEHYYQAEQTGWVLYLKGSTDLAILRAFAEQLDHPAKALLQRPFVVYVGNDLREVRKHFYAIREAKPDFVGVVILDRRDSPLPEDIGAKGMLWRRKEIENYLCFPEVLRAYARHEEQDDLFGQKEADRRTAAMDAAIAEVSEALKTLRKLDPWSPDTKVTDDFLNPLFEKYFEILGLPNLVRKTDYHVLARLVTKDKIDPEVSEKLNAIVETAHRAKPRTETQP